MSVDKHLEAVTEDPLFATGKACAGTPVQWLRSLRAGLIAPRAEDLEHLAEAEPLSQKELAAIKEQFDVRIPQSFLERIKKSQALRRQVVPRREELLFYPEELEDPIGDEVHTSVRGLTHRYQNRALLKLTHHCGVYCRFCFRRYKVSKPGETLSAADLEKVFAYIGSHKEIWEVILSGGDPLILTDKQLHNALSGLRSIDHVRVIRFHTRIPSVLPERITPELVQLLGAPGPKIWIVAHINSADELVPETTRAIETLTKAGIPLLSQSVLLKGVNDSFEQLQSLFTKLVEAGVKPYYLHNLDLAQGTNHFRVELSCALELYAALRSKLSGVCVPQFILDIPGGKGKISVQKENLRDLGNGTWSALSPLSHEWVQFSYPNS